jgi:hypothetical protein
MSYVLGRDLGDRIAAVASIAGSNDVTAPHPIPILHMHGTTDPIAPFNGGNISGTSIVLPAVPDMIDASREGNGCVGEPVTTQLPDVNMGDSSTVELIHYQDCECYSTSSGDERVAEVLFYRIQGGGHTWPGGSPAPGFLGPVNRDIDASQETWNFFSRHALPVDMPQPRGDFNNDGTVDAADYIVWRKGLGTTYTQADYDTWRANFGKTAGIGAALPSAEPLLDAVPEPTAVVLFIFAIASLSFIPNRLEAAKNRC